MPGYGGGIGGDDSPGNEAGAGGGSQGNGGGGDGLTSGQFSVDQYSGIDPEVADPGFDWKAFGGNFALGAPLGPLAAIGLGIYAGTSGMTSDGVISDGYNGGDGGTYNAISNAISGSPTPTSEQDLNAQRYGIASGLMSPYIDASGSARDQLMIEMGLAPGEGGTAYMETPAYQALKDERLNAVQQGTANTGLLYSGPRMKAAADVGGAVQTKFYDNYMSILERMSNPNAATDLSSLGLNQGVQATQQQIGVDQFRSEAMADEKADKWLAGSNIVSAYLSGDFI